jgi:hypothetical protein
VLITAVRALRDLRCIDARVAAKMRVIARSSENRNVAAAVNAALSESASSGSLGTAEAGGG